MYRLYLKDYLVSKGTMHLHVNARNVLFKRILHIILSEESFYITDTFCCSTKDLVIDFTKGDIYFPLPVATIKEEEYKSISHKLTPNLSKYIMNTHHGLISVKDVHVENKYIVKGGHLEATELPIYFTKVNKVIIYKLENLILNENLTSDDLIDSLINRDLSIGKSYVSKKKSIRISRLFIEVQESLGNRVFSGRLNEYMSPIPPVERFILNKYNRIYDSKRIAEIFFNLNIFTVIKLRTDLLTHNGKPITQLLKQNKFFFKLKNNQYYLILKKEWYNWN